MPAAKEQDLLSGLMGGDHTERVREVVAPPQLQPKARRDIDLTSQGKGGIDFLSKFTGDGDQRPHIKKAWSPSPLPPERLKIGLGLASEEDVAASETAGDEDQRPKIKKSRWSSPLPPERMTIGLGLASEEQQQNRVNASSSPRPRCWPASSPPRCSTATSTAEASTRQHPPPRPPP